MRNMKSACTITRSILSTLRLLDQYASSRRHTYTNKDLYMSDFRQKVGKMEHSKHSAISGTRGHKRLAFEGEAAIITEAAFIKGDLGNLSSGGAYITGDRLNFKVDQQVRLKIKPRGQSQTLKSSATVVRIDELPSGRIGYALCFHLV